METTTLQIPLPKSLKASATAVAKDYGFSSLQEIIRVLLAKLARREISVSFNFGEPTVNLSAKNEKRYARMEKDFHQSKNVAAFNNTAELMQDLHQCR